MTLTMVKSDSPNDDDGDECAMLRSRIAAAKARTATARQELEQRRTATDMSLRDRLEDSEQQLAQVEAHFATAIELVREAANLEVERILHEGRQLLALRRGDVSVAQCDGGDEPHGVGDDH